MQVTEHRKLKFNPRAKCYVKCIGVDDFDLYDTVLCYEEKMKHEHIRKIRKDHMIVM